MLSTLNKSAVKCFLKLSKELIKKKKRYIVPRDYDLNGRVISYKQAFIELGIINKDDIWNYILDLCEEDCFDVSNDRDTKYDMNSEMFEFIKEINGKNVYIKLTLRTSDNNDILVCLSFHESVSNGRRG